jgi:hypothetical protein
VKKPLLSSLAPAIADETAAFQERTLTQQRSESNKAQNEALSKWLAGEPQSTTETVKTPLAPYEPTGAFKGTPQEIVEAINSIGDPTERARALQGYKNQIEAPEGYRTSTVTTPPSREARLAHTAEALRMGGLPKAMAMKLAEHQLLKEPELEEARKARLHERQLSLSAAQATKESEQNFRQSIVSQQLQSHADIAAANRQAAAERAAERQQDRADTKAEKAAEEKASNYQIVVDDVTGKGTRVHKITGDKTDLGQVKEPKAPPTLPAGEQNKYNANAATLDSINSILNDKKNDDATGLFTGLAIKASPVWGTKLVNKWSTIGEQERRAEINRLSAIEVHRLYGSAQTLGEIARSGGFMPEPTDSAEQISVKMTKMRDSVRREQDAITQMAASQGYKSPGVSQTGGASGAWTIREK